MTGEDYLKKQGFDVRAELRLKNAKLFKARESLNLTLEEAANKIGISYGSLTSFENLKVYPSKESQEKICEFYRGQGVFLLEEDVFPEKLKDFKGKKHVSEKSIPPERLISLTDLEHRLLTDGGIEYVEEGMKSKQIKSKIEAFLGFLTPRSELFVRLRYGIDNGEGKIDQARKNYDVKDGEVMTYEEIGDYTGISLERIRQIVTKAERKLKRKMKYNKEIIELIGPRTKEK